MNNKIDIVVLYNKIKASGLTWYKRDGSIEDPDFIKGLIKKDLIKAFRNRGK